MNRNLPLRQLAAFEAAARHRSFTKAAVELNVLQPAVSRQIAQLESDTGVILFRRTKPHLTLTRDGETLFSAVTEGMNTMRHTLLALRGDTGKGPLVVNVSLGFMSYYLMTRLAGFRAAYPEIEIELVTCDQYTGYNPDQSDVIVIFGGSGLPGMASVPVMHEELVAVCSPEYYRRHAPCGVADLCRMTSLFMSDPLHLEDWQTFLEGTDTIIRPPPRHERFLSFMVYMQAALAGEGVALTLAGLCGELFQTNQLSLACDRQIRTDRAYFCCLNERAAHNPAAKAFVDWLYAQKPDRVAFP